MKYKTVSALCEGVAGAIRAKEGSTEKINPQDFVQRIENLQVGGGTDGGGIRSSWRYFDVSKSPMQPTAIAIYPTLIKPLGSTEIKYITAIINDDEMSRSIGALGVDGDGILAVLDGVVYTWNEAMAMEGMTPETMAQMNVIEITEEEFLTKTFE